MTDTGAGKPKSGSVVTEMELRPEMGRREENRHTDEQNKQQNLNQGLATETHSSAHSGINWGPSYRMKSPGKRIEASFDVPSASDLDSDAEEKATAIATNDGMPEAPGAKAAE
jgi:hypothetical protein